MSIQNLSDLKKRLEEELKKITTDEALEQFRLQHLSRQGSIAQLFADLKNVDTEQKRVVGPLLNDLKQSIFEQFEIKKEVLFKQKIEVEKERQQFFDVTIAKKSLHGSLHPYTLVTEQIEQIFMSMGFAVADGPELVTDFFNFTALNIPKHHPARQESDTFWIDDEHLLRTQTSTVQIKAMMSQKPPIAIIAPGRTMRNEATDASHDFMFMQVEGLYVDKNVSIAQLLATLQLFLKQFFGKEVKLRVRPGYFPFVEPGLEIDATCPFCNKGCSVCKKTGWIELLGAGLIHPNVLRHCDLDPEIYSGFAFGSGLTRLVMLKYQIPDIRFLHSGNLAFLEQF
ncbi:phenylalanine--tRNA ligase subunit alpha [Candidatus Dependentiae bacterium]|nr:phenylalanine--tRNA ligase subunit alpha [Candidatus Dependentiae bacterium]